MDQAGQHEGRKHHGGHAYRFDADGFKGGCVLGWGGKRLLVMAALNGPIEMEEERSFPCVGADSLGSCLPFIRNDRALNKLDWINEPP